MFKRRVIEELDFNKLLVKGLRTIHINSEIDNSSEIDNFEKKVLKAYNHKYEVTLRIVAEYNAVLNTPHKFTEKINYGNIGTVKECPFTIDLNITVWNLLSRLERYGANKDNHRDWVRYNGTDYEVFINVRRLHYSAVAEYELNKDYRPVADQE